jgi:hypothetical protein
MKTGVYIKITMALTVKRYFRAPTFWQRYRAVCLYLFAKRQTKRKQKG